MSKRLRVLMVEDSEDDAILVLRELRRGGYDPTLERVDTPEAMNAALDQQTWDIVLSDYAMPRFSMPEALAMVREKGLDLPFIIVSGAIGEEAAVAAMRAGAHDYVMKGDPARLAPAVERELREAEVRRERKRMEEALRESEEHYSALVGNLTDAVFKFKGGAITWCNDRVEEIYGYPKDELLGKNASFFYPSDISPSQFTRQVATAIKGRGLFRGTTRFQKKDGSFVDIEYSLAQIPGRDPIEMVAVARDVTERKRAEEALRKSEAQYRLLAENVKDVIVSTDMNARPTYLSPSIEHMLGYSVEEAMNRTMEEALTPASCTVAKERLAKAMAVEQEGQRDRSGSRMVEFEYYRKDGSTVWCEVTVTVVRDADGRPVGLVNVLRDITERKRAEEALQQRERDYSLLLESMYDGIIVVDAETMQVVFGNRRAARMFGFDPVLHDGIGVNVLDQVHPEDKEIVIKGFTEDLHQQERRQRYEARAKTKDGREIWISALATRIEFQGRLAVLLSMIDVTERKKAEEERKRLEHQLQLAGRLAAVGELAAGVAHELNNPLTAVQAFAQFLADRDNLDESIKSDVETIYREAQRATRITTSLLRFARRHKPEKQLVSINKTLEESLELDAYRLKAKNIEVSVELAPDLPKTMADSDQMHQVFVNVISNAEHAMTQAHGKGRLSVKTQRAGETIRIAFTDDGPGISEENLKRIFDPFFTTKGVGKGTGLGLSICYGIVQEHGGHMYARSKPGKGATFVVEIPIVSEDQPIAEHADSTGVQKA